MKIMLKSIVSLLSVVILAVSAAPVVNISFDKEDALYQVGEKAKFTVAFASDNDEPLNHDFKIKLSHDGGKEYVNTTIKVTAPMSMTYEIGADEPGFVRMDVTANLGPDATGKPQNFQKAGTVGFNPEKIQISTPEPDYFWKFWKGEMAKAEETCPLDAKMELLEGEGNDAGYNCYKVSVATPAGRVYGFLSVPMAPGKYPAVVATHGTGAGYDAAEIIPGCVTLLLNALNADPRTPGKTLKELYAESNKPRFHFFTGGYNPQTYFFYRPVIGMARAVNWLAEQPFVEPTAIGYDGSSQGGGFGYFLAALTNRFAYLVIHEPGFCDINGEKVHQRGVGVINYRRIFRTLDKQDGVVTDEEALDKFVECYDAKNFAQHINKDCIVRVGVGFLDFACPPSGVYAVYNSLNVADKEIFTDINLSHGNNKKFHELCRWMQDELRGKCGIHVEIENEMEE